MKISRKYQENTLPVKQPDETVQKIHFQLVAAINTHWSWQKSLRCNNQKCKGRMGSKCNADTLLPEIEKYSKFENI